jgi:hypothetical protein
VGLTVEEEFHVIAYCPQCGWPVDAWLEEVPRANPDRYVEATAEVELDCETCGRSFDVTIRTRLNGGWEAFLTEDPSEAATFEHYDYRYDEWINELEPEPHPRAIFNEAIKEWGDLVDDIADKASGSAAVNRMLLVQLFSIVEANLSDAILKLAHDDPSVASAIIQWHPELKGENVSLKRVATEPNLVRDIVVAQLRKTQFHRFQFVDGLLKASLAHDMLPADKDIRDVVMASVQTRHHCVHRNGRDPEGRLVTTLTIDYLVDLAAHLGDIVARLADRIEGAGRDPAHTRLKAIMEDPFDQYPRPDASSPPSAASP